MPRITQSKKKLPPEEIHRLHLLAEKIDREEGDEIRALLRRYKRESERLISIFRQLQAERQRQGLSLADVAERSGMDKGRLSRLENDAHPNVTLDTVDRYAAALGKQVVCALADADSP